MLLQAEARQQEALLAIGSLVEDRLQVGDGLAARQDGLFQAHAVSALEIEAELRLHPAIEDACVIGLPDPEWGERVAAALILRPGFSPQSTPGEIELWLRERLAPYKVPRVWKVVAEFPRNALGKVTKKAVLAGFAR